jgi:hypothetical protein
VLKLEASWCWVVVSDRSRRPYPWGRAGTHCAGRWVGSTAGLNSSGEEKITCHTGNRRENLQPVASRYIDVIPAPYERYASSYRCYSLVPCCVVCAAQVPLSSVVECKTDIFQNQYWVSSMLYILNWKKLPRILKYSLSLSLLKTITALNNFLKCL